jgi:aryl-alcohol dehydrogenase-like predicted oxidoreductase
MIEPNTGDQVSKSMAADFFALPRRMVLSGVAALGLAALFRERTAFAGKEGPSMLMRPIPSTGELLPAVGMGTGINFGKDGEPETAARRQAIAQVIATLIDGGGSIIDTKSAYRPAENVIGEILAKAKLRRRAFIATKLESWELPRSELWQGSLRATVKGVVNSYAPFLTHPDIQGALERLQTDNIDLMQIHGNLDSDLAPLREWKSAKIIRYTGITASSVDFAAEEMVMRREKPDFLQVHYSLFEREAEKRILPLAADLGIAVIIDRPLGGRSRFLHMRERPLPDWASDFAAVSWSQLFLKYVLSHPNVTAAIPGTTQPTHMAENLGAGGGPLPDREMRHRMVQLIESFS